MKRSHHFSWASLVSLAVMPVCLHAILAGSAAAVTPTTTIEGEGTNESPYVGECSDPLGEHCTIDTFERRTVEPWHGGFVPAYRCPADHPWLVNHDYAPIFTALPLGVEVDGLGPIGVSITGAFSDVERDQRTAEGVWRVYRGTRTGFPWSHARNWSAEQRTYRVVLHCTNNFDQAKVLSPFG